MSPDFIMFAVLGIMIVFMFMSNKKRKKATQDLQNSVVPGVQVMLTSGIFGTVIEADEARVTIESTPGTRLVVNRLAVRQVEAVAAVEPVKSAVAKSKAAAQPSAKATAKPAAKKPAAKKPAAK